MQCRNISIFRNLYFCPWAATTHFQQDCIACCLTYNLKNECIFVFTTYKLYRFSKSVMTVCQRPSLKLLSSTNRDPGLLILILKPVKREFQLFSVARYNFEEVFSLCTQHFINKWNLVLILTYVKRRAASGILLKGLRKALSLLHQWVRMEDTHKELPRAVVSKLGVYLPSTCFYFPFKMGISSCSAGTQK